MADAIIAEVAKVNPSIQPVGPEIAFQPPAKGSTSQSLNYLLHFLNGSNHHPPAAPAISSYHWASLADSGADGRGGEKFLDDWEATLTDPNSPPMRSRNGRVYAH